MPNSWDMMARMQGFLPIPPEPGEESGVISRQRMAAEEERKKKIASSPESGIGTVVESLTKDLPEAFGVQPQPKPSLAPDRIPPAADQGVTSIPPAIPGGTPPATAPLTPITGSPGKGLAQGTSKDFGTGGLDEPPGVFKGADRGAISVRPAAPVTMAPRAPLTDIQKMHMEAQNAFRNGTWQDIAPKGPARAEGVDPRDRYSADDNKRLRALMASQNPADLLQAMNVNERVQRGIHGVHAVAPTFGANQMVQVGNHPDTGPVMAPVGNAPMINPGMTGQEAMAQGNKEAANSFWGSIGAAGKMDENAIARAKAAMEEYGLKDKSKYAAERELGDARNKSQYDIAIAQGRSHEEAARIAAKSHVDVARIGKDTALSAQDAKMTEGMSPERATAFLNKRRAERDLLSGGNRGDRGNVVINPSGGVAVNPAKMAEDKNLSAEKAYQTATAWDAYQKKFDAKQDSAGNTVPGAVFNADDIATFLTGNPDLLKDKTVAGAIQDRFKQGIGSEGSAALMEKLARAHGRRTPGVPFAGEIAQAATGSPMKALGNAALNVFSMPGRVLSGEQDLIPPMTQTGREKYRNEAGQLSELMKLLGR